MSLQESLHLDCERPDSLNELFIKQFMRTVTLLFKLLAMFESRPAHGWLEIQQKTD